MNIGDLMDRVLGFMPQRSVFWFAVGTFLLSLLIQYLNHWLKKVTKLPWMLEENQRKREEILQGKVSLSHEQQGGKK
ncbi:hypothetical protein [Caldalkalibacillus mannanilyticus]|uniref:hypothetical protein n=1 Tax=Caldalkalibacillus mannanilyticus TaxID=1418 RepID=UPI00046817DD|nr:hypothetical protein [Caldalkalibacillus mannanilyticus]